MLLYQSVGDFSWVPTQKAWMIADNLRFFIWYLEHHIYQYNGCSKCCSRQPYEEILHRVFNWGKINLFTPFCLYLHKTDMVTESCINILLWQYLFMQEVVNTTKENYWDTCSSNRCIWGVEQFFRGACLHIRACHFEKLS